MNISEKSLIELANLSTKGNKMDKEEREQEISKMFVNGKPLPPIVDSIKVVADEILLEHVFRVWCRGRGKDYRVTLTPSGLTLVPHVSKASTPPPFCCICPYSPSCIARCQFHQRSTSKFCSRRSQKRKTKTLMT